MGSSTDDVFEALADRCRRRLFLALVERDPPAEITVDDVCSGAVDDDPADRTELRHAHLPKLDAMGFIDWDPGTGTIRPGPELGAIRPVVRLLADRAPDLPFDWP
jgi:hypothetical protein